MSHPPERPDVTRDAITRREVLQAGAGVALTAALAGCGLGGASSGGDTTRRITPKVDGDLVYFNWAQYLDPSLFKEFEKRYGVTVQQSNFDSMPAMMAKLQSGNHYDLIFPSAEFTHKLVGADRLLEIPHDKLEHDDVVLSHFHDPWYDRGSAHTVPYSLYVTGLGYRADKVQSMTGSWRDITNPDAGGRSYMLDDYQEGIGMGNLVNGYGLNCVDADKLDKTKDYLVGIKPDLRGYTSDTITSMASGDAWIQHLWNGDIVNIRYRVDNPEDIKFEKCREGLPVGSDCFAIPTDAQHPGTALLFIDFMLEKSAQNVKWTGYPMATTNSANAYSNLVKGDPELVVTVHDLKIGDQYADLEGDDRLLWDRTWTEVKAV
jgi:spermidine/putrescine transport system substrate-binding protein